MGLIPNTYDGLVSAARAVAEDDSQEFLDYAPTAVFLAEERLTKEVGTEGMDVISYVPVTAGTTTLTKPTGYKATHDLSFMTSSGRKFLDKKTAGYLLDYWPNQAQQGQPKYYADQGYSSVLIAPTAASAYSVRWSFVGQPTKLSDTNQTNYFTQECADMLYFDTMSNMCAFMHDWATQAKWEGQYQERAQALENQARRQRRDDAPANNPRDGVNTLKGNGN